MGMRVLSNVLLVLCLATPLQAQSPSADGLQNQLPGAHDYRARAEARFQQGDLHGARADFRKTLELEPGDVESAVGLARIALAAGDDQGALNMANAILAVQPESRDARMVKALAETCLNQPKAGLTDLQIYLESHPPADHQTAAAYLLRGMYLQFAGERAAAGSDYRRALLIWPDYPEARVALTRLQHTLALREGNYDNPAGRFRVSSVSPTSMSLQHWDRQERSHGMAYPTGDGRTWRALMVDERAGKRVESGIRLLSSTSWTVTRYRVYPEGRTSLQADEGWTSPPKNLSRWSGR